MVKNLPAMQVDMGSIPVLGRSPREGNCNPLQCSCLENPMNRGAWWATVHGVAKTWTRLSDFPGTQWATASFILAPAWSPAPWHLAGLDVRVRTADALGIPPAGLVCVFSPATIFPTPVSGQSGSYPMTEISTNKTLLGLPHIPILGYPPALWVPG